MARDFATRETWNSAAAGEMWGSSPEPEAVTSSTGTGLFSNLEILSEMASRSAGLVGPRFDPDDEAPL